jgi:ribosomal-protein-alanine N-acetyltransferase
VVARPRLSPRIEAMGLGDLDAVQEIERRSFRTPWPAHAYRTELETNRLASYLVARLDGRVVGYGGMWLMVDEAHITTFAVDPDYRRGRIGERLLLALLDLASARHAHAATLEVRLSNLAARRLYEKYGFRPVGLRPRYYSDDNEDALIMTTDPLAEPGMQERVARLRAALEAEEVAAGAGADRADGADGTVGTDAQFGADAPAGGLAADAAPGSGGKV